MTKRHLLNLAKVAVFAMLIISSSGIISFFKTGSFNGLLSITSLNDLVYGYGGGGSSISKDFCPNGDNSASYYDNSCGTTTVVVKSSSGEVESNLLSGEVESNLLSEEDAAYKFAFSKGITTMTSLKDADMRGNLTRGQMAKMMVNYAINVLGKTINTGAVCEFSDNAKQSTEMKEYAVKACQLGLMGKNTKKFMPTSTVTRAELATVLSRMLYNTEDSGANYYTNHLKVLKEKGIITNDTPSLKETRGYVMLMLMRSSK